MLIGVVHAAGGDAAGDVVARLIQRAGKPHALTMTGHAVVAAWRSGAPLQIAGACAVEGVIESSSDVEDATRPGFHDWLSCARGDFALMAAGAGGLVLASGPVGGHRPIFVARSKHWTAAGTRLRGLLSLLEELPPVDLDYISASTLAGYPLSPTATPYSGISHVPLCEAWVVRAGVAEERFSLLLDPPRDEARGSDEDLARILRGAIDKAVERCAQGVASIGVMLSGGVDSSSVFVALERLRREGRVSAAVEGYAWEFDTPDPGDDRPYRRAVERRVGKPSWPVTPEAAGPFVRRSMVLDGAPCVDIPCSLWLALDAEASRRGTERILTGIGGDNVLQGDPHLLGELGRRGHPVRAVRKAIALRGLGRTSAFWRVRELVMRPWARSLAPAPLRRAYRRRHRRKRFDWMGPRFETWLDARAAESPPDLTLDSSPAERYAWLARIPFMADQALIRSQQEEVMRCKRADPLFDDNLMRVVATLPPLALLSGDFARGLMRRAMSDALPREVTTRGDKAYMEPALARMLQAAGGFDAFEDLAHVRRLSDLGLVEPKPFRAHFERVARQPLEPFWWSVWPALAVEEFLRQYEDGWGS